MTGGALAIPVVGESLPMQRVIVHDGFVGLKIDPALPTRFARPRIPRHGERLEAPVGSCHEILLKRIRTERVGHAQTLERTSRLFQLDDIVLAVTNEFPCSFEVRKTRAVESTDDSEDPLAQQQAGIDAGPTAPSDWANALAVELRGTDLETGDGAFWGTVVDEQGRPLAGALVKAISHGEYDSLRFTNDWTDRDEPQVRILEFVQCTSSRARRRCR